MLTLIALWTIALLLAGILVAILIHDYHFYTAMPKVVQGLNGLQTAIWIQRTGAR